MGYLKDVDADDKLKAMLTTNVDSSSLKKDITGEKVTFAAGVAGTTGVVALRSAPIYNDEGALVGTSSDTSFAWITGTILTTEVEYRADWSDATQFAAMSNGEYAIDYTTGRIRYKKATASVTDTCSYITRDRIPTEYTIKYAYDGLKVEYTGYAQPGSAASAARWRIKKYTYDGNNVTDIQWAKSSANASDYLEFNKVWDSRPTYTYE